MYCRSEALTNNKNLIFLFLLVSLRADWWPPPIHAYKFSHRSAIWLNLGAHLCDGLFKVNHYCGEPVLFTNKRKAPIREY